MNNPLVSILLAVHNDERFVRQAIDSALHQTCREIELIVIDDASTDSTPTLLAGCADPRLIRLRNNPALGAGASLNRCLSAARGRYVALLGSGDVWHPEKLKKQTAWLEAHPEDGACFAWADPVDETGRVLTERESPSAVCRQPDRPPTQWMRDLLLQGGDPLPAGLLCRRDDLLRCGGFSEALSLLPEYDMLLRLLALSRPHMLCEPLLSVRRPRVPETAERPEADRVRRERASIVTDAVRRMPGEMFAAVFADALTVSPYDPQLETYEKGRLLSERFDDEAIRRAGLALLRDALRSDAVRQKTGLSLSDLPRPEDAAPRVGLPDAVRQKAANACRRSRLALRKGVNAAKDRLRRYDRFYRTLGLIKLTVLQGPRAALREWQDARRIRAIRIAQWPDEAQRAARRGEAFRRDITFSILVPLYNTPENYLREMIESVQAQTYEKWELCLADGSDRDGCVETVCRAYAAQDERIRYTRLPENRGLSGNTNAALALSTGDYIALLDHDDLLHPFALSEVMRAVCEQNADFIYTDEAHFHETPEDADCPNYKPDFSPDTLRSYNYICHLSVFSRELMEEAGGGLRSEYDGSQDYDLILRLTEKARRIAHIPQILYLWRVHAGSTASGIAAKPYTLDAARRALAAHLRRVGLSATVADARIPSTYDIRYAIEGQPLVSILIPNKDHAGDLRRCIGSIREKTTWPNWEIVLIENNSADPATFRCYEELQRDGRVRVVTYEGGFNFSAINNFGAREARGQYLLLLNNDTEVISPDWIERMLMFAQRPDVGVAGCMLYYPDDTVQHAGVILGIGGFAGHSHKYFKRGEYGFMSRLGIAQNLSAVTAACALFRRDVWEQVNGLDEQLAVVFNDVDLCLRIRQAGYLVVWTPFAELYHYESRSRGKENTPEKQQRFHGEIAFFCQRWQKLLDAGDPYYNPHLTLRRENFSLR